MKRILIVEDEVITAMHLSDLLEKWGFEAGGPVASGEEAIKRAHEEPPGLVLMDVRLMGEMSGIEAAKRINSELGIPVILMSGYSKDVITSSANGNGNIRYISKPLDLEKLKSLIESQVNKA